MYSKLQDGSFIVCGYVARDAELKTVGEKNSSLCRWSVKVGEKNNGEKNEAVWTSCQAWHDVAKYAACIKKGDTVLCIGKLKTNTGSDGKTYINLECEFISIMKKIPEIQPVAPDPSTEEINDFSDFVDVLSEEDTPF